MARGLKFRILIEEELQVIHVAKTKALISFAVTAKLICVFVFAYAKKPVFSRRGSIIFYINIQLNEPCHEKTSFLHM